MFKLIVFYLLTDAPKFQTNHTIFFSWEGNPVNISCEVMSNPVATMLWRRDKLTIPIEGTANMRVHSAPGKSLLEVLSHSHICTHCTIY